MRSFQKFYSFKIILLIISLCFVTACVKEQPNPQETQKKFQETIEEKDKKGKTITRPQKQQFSIAFDRDTAGFNKIKNIPTGVTSLVGKIIVKTGDEPILLKDLPMQNVGSATNEIIIKLLLYSKGETSTKALCETKFDDGKYPLALFKDINYELPKNSTVIFYIGIMIKKLKDTKGKDVEAFSKKRVFLRIPQPRDGYRLKITNKDTGKVIKNHSINHTSASRMVNIVLSE